MDIVGHPGKPFVLLWPFALASLFCATMSAMDMQKAIADKLEAALAPAHLDVEDESHMHNVPEGAQSHFKVTVVAQAFSGQPLVARHRRVFAILSEEMAGSVHALALHALSPDEWRRQPEVPDSPPCRGGSRQSSAS